MMYSGSILLEYASAEARQQGLFWGVCPSKHLGPSAVLEQYGVSKVPETIQEIWKQHGNTWSSVDEMAMASINANVSHIRLLDNVERECCLQQALAVLKCQLRLPPLHQLLHQPPVDPFFSFSCL
eukprot:5636755-Amphidinium_carterae.1